MSDTNKEERELFFKKVFALLESTLLNEWVSSEVKLSSRYEQMGKAYRGKLKNKITPDVKVYA